MKSVFYSVSLSSLLLIGCAGGNGNSGQEELKEFPVTQVFQKDTVLFREYVSDINAVRNVEIRARVKGYLDHILVDEGQSVKKGQVLFRINDEEYRMKLSSTKASRKSLAAKATAAELELKRIKTLAAKQVISNVEVSLAEANYNAAIADMEEAKSEEANAEILVTHTAVKAPFDGVVGRIPFKVGSLIDEGTLLTTVADIEFIHAYFEVTENEYLRYARDRKAGFRNQKIELLLADGSAYPHAGEVETMENEFATSTGTIAFRARFPNPEKLLKHGASGKVRLSSPLANAIIIPQKATFEIQDKTYVFIVQEDSTVVMRSFVTKARLPRLYIIESGLKPGEKIVYEGVQNIREGMQIKMRLMPADSITAFLSKKTRQTS